MVSPNEGSLFGIRKQRREIGIQWRKAIKEIMKLLKTWGTTEVTAFKAQEIRHLSAEKLEMENYLGT